ncbi:MAG: hypothetical protein RL150_549 [Candidatus Parcubacteria bacterium]|jgi:hypothetical protein
MNYFIVPHNEITRRFLETRFGAPCPLYKLESVIEDLSRGVVCKPLFHGHFVVETGMERLLFPHRAEFALYVVTCKTVRPASFDDLSVVSVAAA